MIGIYKFTNKINNKVYIGQSKNIEHRYARHIYDAKKGSNTIFHQSIREYGIDNFNFEIIEECTIDKLNEKEQYYIKYYNSLIPNGYNMQPGGQPKHFMKYFKFDKNDILEIYNVIADTNKTFNEIAEEYNVSATMIRYINLGIEYALDGINYPIRDQKTAYAIKNNSTSNKLQGERSYKCTITETVALNIISDLIETLLTSVQIAKKYSTTTDVVKDINRNKS